MTQTQQQNVPPLRFPEFSGEWVHSVIDDHFEFKNGLNKEKEFFGKGTPIINFMDVYKLSAIKRDVIKGLVSLSDAEKDRFSAKKGDVFFTRTSETILDIGMSATLVEDIQDCVFSGFVLRARPRESSNFDCFFTSFCFSTNSIRKEIVTKSSFTTRALTSGTLLKKVIFNYPTTKKEQQKIASFLSSVDGKIEQLGKKKALLEQYKKGMMQKLFSQELRFKDAQGNDFPDWEEKRLGDVATRRTEKNSDLKHTRVLTNSAVRGVIDQGDYFDHAVANAENLGGYYIVELGDFVYNPRISVTAPVGPIKRNDLGAGVMSPLYSVFRFRAKYTAFYEQYFAASFWHKYMKSVANYGARHDRMAISTKDFMNMPLPYPCSSEQQKIADFLSSIDRKIDHITTELDHAKTFKKGLLQQMFI